MTFGDESRRHQHRGQPADGRAVQRIGTRFVCRDRDWQSEPLLLIELTNVLATVVRKLAYTLDDATAILHNAQRLMAPGLRRVADQDVLNAAAHFGVTGYDARFLVVARAIGTRLVTEDGTLRRAAPDLTCSLAEALAH